MASEGTSGAIKGEGSFIRALTERRTAMLHLQTALYLEAKPFIGLLGMKRVQGTKAFQIFESPRARLLVSGSGPAAAAAGAAMLLSGVEGGIAANVGVAAAKKSYSRGEIVVVNAIENTFTKRVSYPEMLYKHHFREAGCATFGKAQKSRISGRDLADMEAAFFWETACKFVEPSRILCVKVVLDQFDPKGTVSSEMEKVMQTASAPIIKWLDGIDGLHASPTSIFTKEEEMAIEKVADCLFLTFTLKKNLESLCAKAKARNEPILPALEEYQTFRPSVKTEGKVLYENLRKLLDKQPDEREQPE